MSEKVQGAHRAIKQSAMYLYQALRDQGESHLKATQITSDAIEEAHREFAQVAKLEFKPLVKPREILDECIKLADVASRTVGSPRRLYEQLVNLQMSLKR